MTQETKADKPNEKGFRDKLATIDDTGKRLWVYAKIPKGKLTTLRNIVGIFLLILMFAGPFITINGHPLLLLNFIDRKIVIFGMQFWPQDFHLFFLAMLSLFVFIILFTVTYGRVWCGWTCPQTVFLEIVFRRIEYWIEGGVSKQKKLSAQAWNAEKIFKRGLKHFIFFSLSFIISNTFLAYIIGIDALKAIITDNPANHVGGLVAMIIFSGVFYFVFSYFREQVCTLVCPYGRLQGVLLDRNSIVVCYDYKRGEPRDKLRKGEDRSAAGKGHCVNCSQCVQVCPTGIDIRNGTQLECINCTACIDACNSMMEQVNQPKGLIRYSSEKMISSGKKMGFNPRTIAYSIVLLLLLALFTFLFFKRSDVETTILRAPGLLYQEQPDGRISNLYNIKMLNKTYSDIPIDIRLQSHPGEIVIVGNDMYIEEQSLGESVFFIYMDRETLSSSSEKIVIGIYSGDELLEEIESSFMSPDK
jgi:cytochrome c oxidase accessory protein FixG